VRQEFARAPEVAAIGARLIEHFHPHLSGVRVDFLFVSKPPVVGGEKKSGRARVVRGLWAYLAGEPKRDGEPEEFFVIEIWRTAWLKLKAEQRVALVDHELCHCGYDDEHDTLKIIPHDIEEHNAIAERHGAWHGGLELFGELLDDDAHRVGRDEQIAEIATATRRPAAREEKIAAIAGGRGRERVEALARGRVKDAEA
jgi:hypothetical protein